MTDQQEEIKRLQETIAYFNWKTVTAPWCNDQLTIDRYNRMCDKLQGELNELQKAHEDQYPQSRKAKSISC